MKAPAKTCPACGDGHEGSVLFCPKDGTPLAGVKAPTLTGTPDRDPYLGIELAGQIRLKHLIGIGSMGRVYRAFQSGIERDVAVKILHRELSSNRELVGRFHREAKVASRLVHPHVVQVLMTGAVPFCADPSIGGELYLVMEHLDGISLLSALAATGEGSALPLPRALHIALQICDAVGEAHVQGIVHRDIKPENVMLVPRGDDPDYVKVLDFGIARLTGGDSSLATTKAGLIFGTAKYISPEGAEGRPVGPQADVYAIATIVYQCLSGRTPFDGDTPVALLLQHTSTPAPDLLSIARASYVPAPVARVVMAGLAKNPTERAANARAFGRDLVAALRAAGLDADEIAGSVSSLTGRAGTVKVASRERTRALHLSPELASQIGAVAASPARTLAGMPGAGPAPAARSELMAPQGRTSESHERSGSAATGPASASSAEPAVAGGPLAGAVPVQATMPEGAQDADPARQSAPGRTVPGEPPPSGAFRPPSGPGRRPSRRGGAPGSRGVRAPWRSIGTAELDFDAADSRAPARGGVTSSHPPGAPPASTPGGPQPVSPGGAPLSSSSFPAAAPSFPAIQGAGSASPLPAHANAGATTATSPSPQVQSDPGARRLEPTVRSRPWLLSVAALVVAAALVATAVVVRERPGSGAGATLDGRIEAARGAMQRRAWEAPAQPNVRDIALDARDRWPGDPRVAELLREASERLVADALGHKYAGDLDGARRLARLAAELSADVTAAQGLVAELELGGGDLTPAAGADEPRRKTSKGQHDTPRPAVGAPSLASIPTATPSADAVLPPTPPPLPSGHAPAPARSGPWL